MRKENFPRDRLNFRHIPVLPSGATYLMQAMMDNSLNFHQVSSIIENFPSIAARLISLANSVWSSPVTPITSLDTACARLGFDVVRSTSIALAVASPFDPFRCPSFDAIRFWNHSLLVADTSTWLSQLLQTNINNLDPQTARTAGLVHDLGLLWLVDQLPEEADQAIHIIQNNSTVSLDDALLDIIGIDHFEVGKILGEAWKLPEPLIMAMSHQLLLIMISSMRGDTKLLPVKK